MKQLKYVNSQNKEINFREFNTQIFQGNFHTYEWTYSSVAQQYGEKIEAFKKEPLRYEMVVAARGTEKEKNLNKITEIIEHDVLNKKPAKLWWGEYYINCFVIASSTIPSDNFYGVEKTLKIIAPYPFWIRELSRSFYALTSPAQPEGLGYSYDYLYDYSAEDGDKIWQVDHYAASDYEMVIYGPCIDPRINIAGHPYEIFDTVEKGEYVVINSQNHTAVKHRTNGTKVNLFDFRGKINRLFTKIPGGNIPVSWSGSFGFDITLFLERSEPAW